MFTLDYQPIDCKTVLEQSTPANPLPDNRTGQFTIILTNINN